MLKKTSHAILQHFKRFILEICYGKDIALLAHSQELKVARFLKKTTQAVKLPALNCVCTLLTYIKQGCMALFCNVFCLKMVRNVTPD